MDTACFYERLHSITRTVPRDHYTYRLDTVDPFFHVYDNQI